MNINENENLNENVPAEEVENVQEEPVAEEAAEPNKRQPVEKPKEDDEPYDVVIETSRASLFEAYNKSRKISNLITVIVLVAAIASMILITQQDALLTVLGWVLVGVSLLSLIIYYVVNKNKFPNKTRAYIKELTKRLNQNTFADEQYSDVVSDPEEKMSIEDVIGDSVYDNLGSIASRNVVRGKFNGKDFLYTEMALTKSGATKKDGPLFVGKYISVPNNLELRGRIIINFKNAENPVDLPTSIGNLDLLEESNGMTVYGFKDTDYKQVLGTLFLSKIKALVPESHLLNTNIVIWAGKTGFYFSYDDASMALPFDKPFDRACNEEGVAHTLAAFEANDVLGK